MEKKHIQNIIDYFIGDIENETYLYKSGPKLVNFFNENFGFEDIYPTWGSNRIFPSRWKYVLENLKILKKQKRLDEFILFITSNNYIKTEVGTEALIDKQLSALEYFNENLKEFGVEIVYKNGIGKIIKINEDLIKIGEGGFCIVYKSKSKKIAIKKLKEENYNSKFQSRFKREYNIMKELENTDGVLKVYNFDEKNYQYTMELMDSTLYEYVKDNTLTIAEKTGKIEEIIKIMISVEKLHIHRDLNPNNILLDKQNKVYISDFGLGKNIDAVHSHETAFTSALGTLEYCAPEQIEKLAGTTIQADIYSFGKIINFIMSGNSKDYEHVYKVIAHKCTQRDSSNRYKSFIEVNEALEKTIQKKQEAKNVSEINNKLNSGTYDEACDYFIIELNYEKYSNFILDENKKAVLKHIEYNDINFKRFIQLAKDNTTFTKCDGFTDIIYDLLIGNNVQYADKMTLCEILNYYATDLNRYYTQNKMKIIKTKELIDPTLIELFRYE